MKPKIPNYEVIRKLGTGSIKKAYLARNIHSGDESVFLTIDPNSRGFRHYKNIHPTLTEEDLKEKIYQEEFSGTKLRNLEDPRFIGLISPPILGEDEQGKRAYFLETKRYSHTLEEELEKEVEETTAIKYAHQMAIALSNCHNSNITHKDLKPDNIGISEEGNIVVSDFGCTTLFSDSGKTRYQYPLLLRPPELAHPEEHWEPKKWQSNLFTPEANIWSLGAIYYKIITGKHLFKLKTPRAKQSTPKYQEQNKEAYQQIQRFDRTHLKKIKGSCIATTMLSQEILSACLHKDPKDREAALELIIDMTKEYSD